MGNFYMILPRDMEKLFLKTHFDTFQQFCDDKHLCHIHIRSNIKAVFTITFRFQMF